MNNGTLNKLSFDELLAKANSLEAEVGYLKHELGQLRRLIFGQKRERFVPEMTANQIQIDLGEVAAEVLPEKTEPVSYTRRIPSAKKQTPHSRNPLPAFLPRQDIIIEPAVDTTGMKKIGEEITEELEYEPGKLFVKRYIRPKYVNPAAADEGATDESSSVPAVVIGNLPTRPIEKGIPGPGLLAHILISKFCDHLPWYRQHQQFKRLGVTLAISTMGDWHKFAGQLLQPLYDKLLALLLAGDYLMADETPIPVLDREKKGKTRLGYLWVYYSPLTRLVYFDYQPDHRGQHPRSRLKDFKGYLQTDGYAGYRAVQQRPDIIALNCMAHARRKFIEALPTDPVRGAEILAKFGQLYDIERQAREGGLTFAARYELRQRCARPILDAMKTWLEVNIKQVTPKSAMGGALAYALTHWSRLENYLKDGRLEIDNNLVENQIRPVALGRKNYLFAGSHDGARRAAMIYSLVGTAKQHQVEPFAWLKDVLSRISDHPHHQLEKLLPKNWTPSSK